MLKWKKYIKRGQGLLKVTGVYKKGCVIVCACVCLSMCGTMCLSISLSLCDFLCLSLGGFLCLRVCASLCVFVWLSLCVGLCLSVCLSFCVFECEFLRKVYNSNQCTTTKTVLCLSSAGALVMDVSIYPFNRFHNSLKSRLFYLPGPHLERFFEW